MNEYDKLRAAHADAIARARAAIDGVGQNFADDPSVQLASTVDYLSAERDEWKRRAEAAEAQLAAVPVDALWRYLRYAQVPEHHHRYIEDQQEADRAAISAWLAAQPEAQP